MNVRIFIIVLVFCFVHQAYAQHISYSFMAPNAVHHEAVITVLAEGIDTTPAVFRMSRSSPGRYATHEFGKNVYDVKADDGKGHTLVVVKTDAEVYTVPKHRGRVRLTYTLYGNYADGTYAGIDATNYHLNMPATFMWLKGYDNALITVHFDVPLKWKIATQLTPTSDPNTFTAPGLQLFMDAPVKIGRLLFSEWNEANGDKQFRFRLALEADATQAGADSLARQLKKIVETEKKVFGEFPDYDWGMYTFIASINPYVHGDGMEHRNSTMISLPVDFTEINNLYGVFSHEFFHCWNVERIRPKTIEPFNFEKSNMCDGLWLAEGFTRYYDQLILVRAGLAKPESFIQKAAGLINAKDNTPGGKYYSPIENSQRAVYADASVAIDKNNYPNMYTSYYAYGGAIALALDLELRSRFHKTLDDYMRLLWVRYGKTEIAYTMEGLQEALAAISNEAYAADFFDHYIFGHKRIEYALLLQQMGYTLERQDAGKAWIGDISKRRNGDTLAGLKLTSNTVVNTPLYRAGLDVDDVILQLDNKTIMQDTDITNVLASHKPGDMLGITFRHHVTTRHTTITADENPDFVIKPMEEKGKKITDNQADARKGWLGQ